MAAPPAKPSPSIQAVQQTDAAAAAAAAGVASSTTAANEVQLKAPPPLTSLAPPTYASVEASENYCLAKTLLNAGSFEEALSVIEQELETTKALLLSTAGNVPQELMDVDLHEAVAPLHYLYGTTLLYSLEESKDDNMTATTAMTVNVPSAAAADANDDDSKPRAEAAAASAVDNPWANLPSDPSSAMADAAAVAAVEEQPQPAAAEDDAEDIQIAWENFEVARAIVEKMLVNNYQTPDNEKKLKLDLAQILLREGDLQRMNGRYNSAIQDYSQCLELRQAYLDKWNRKIADTQFNLGLTYLQNSSELQKETTEAAASAGEGNPAASTPNAKALAKEHCEKGIAFHVECAKTFGGILAELCESSPEELLKRVANASADDDDSCAKKPAAAGFKTTGLDDDMSSAATTEASQNLNRLRKSVTSLVAINPPKDTAASDSVYDIQQVLDEIQETVDEAERSLDAVSQAAQIKIQAQQQAAALSGPADGTVVSTSEDGATTSIGFGRASTSAAAATPVASSAQPMMMVKKKKKRSAEEEQDSKPAAAPVDSKRAKTEE